MVNRAEKVREVIRRAVEAMGSQKAAAEAAGVTSEALSNGKRRGDIGLDLYLKLEELGKHIRAPLVVATLIGSSAMMIGYAPESSASVRPPVNSSAQPNESFVRLCIMLNRGRRKIARWITMARDALLLGRRGRFLLWMDGKNTSAAPV